VGILRYGAAHEVLVVTKGHPFARDAFFACFEGWPDIAATAVEQPAAQHFFAPGPAADFAAFVLYDMPGIEFAAGGARFHEPSSALEQGFEALLEQGKGFVFLHHALAGWPTWDRYGEVVGGRFLYAPGEVRGEALPDSGYRHEVKHRISLLDPSHPVVAGVEDGFEIEDEVYLCPIFDEESVDVVPLLESDYDFRSENFYSASLALRGEMFSREGWTHPPGSRRVGWARRVGRSPIVTLTLGDGPTAYGNPAFGKLLENSIRWVVSDAAREWAAQTGGGGTN